MHGRLVRNHPPMRRISIIAAVALVTAALFPASWNRVDASSRSTPVNGHIRSQMVAGPFCTSPVQLCTAGRFNGGIQGEFEFTATSLTPTPTAGVFFYTGTIVVHTQRDKLFCADAGVFNTAGDGELAVSARSRAAPMTWPEPRDICRRSELLPSPPVATATTAAS
jgi:hypothetical protein